MTGLEHSIKMDELLLSWLGKDQVYSKVFSLIEGLRISGESSPMGDTPSSPMTSQTSGPANSADSARGQGSKSPHSVIIPPFFRPPGTLTPDGKKAPPLLRRRKSSHSTAIGSGGCWKEDQLWDGPSSTSHTIAPNHATLSPPSPVSAAMATNVRSQSPLIPVKDQVKIIFLELGKVLPGAPPSSLANGNSNNLSPTSLPPIQQQTFLSKLPYLYLTIQDFKRVTKDICNFPSFFNGPLYKRILYLYHVRNIKDPHQQIKVWDEIYSQALPLLLGKDLTGQPPADVTKWSKLVVTYDMVHYFWTNEMEDYDIFDRFYRLIKKPKFDFISKEDFMPFLRELLLSHPVGNIWIMSLYFLCVDTLSESTFYNFDSKGLEFLASHAEFQDKYAITVITRIFYSVNRCHSGRITARQIRRSDLVFAFEQVDEEEDINRVTRYFSYEHFYVLYCRFWELDTDRDYRITRKDLINYAEGSLHGAIIDRIFDAAPRPFGGSSDATASPSVSILKDENNYSFAPVNRDFLTYEDFIFFMLSEEDKANEVSIRYWFTCLDVDGDGCLNNMEMRSFYAVQMQQLQRKEVQDIVPFKDMLCQMIDMIKPQNKEYLIVEDFLQPQCLRVSGLLFDALFNVNKYMQFEQRDPFMEKGKKEEGHETDWDRFAYYDYNRLAMEEEAREEEAMEIDWVSVDEDDDSGFNSLAAASEAPF